MMTGTVEERLARDGIVLVRCGLWRYNALGIVGAGAAAAVDPGITPDEIAALRARLVAGGRDVAHVVLTHAHHDHLRGWDAFPGAEVILPAIGAAKGDEARKRILAGMADVDVRLGLAPREWCYPTPHVTFEERHCFEVGGVPVELRSLPGHSNCTSVVLLPEQRTLLSADYLVHPGLPYCRFEARPFEEAHRRMRAWVESGEVARVVPAHEDVLETPEAILAALDEELAYFAHLRALVREALAHGENEPRLLRRCAAAMAERRMALRGEDAGRRGIQDLDNTKRVLAEERQG